MGIPSEVIARYPSYLCYFCLPSQLQSAKASVLLIIGLQLVWRSVCILDVSNGSHSQGWRSLQFPCTLYTEEGKGNPIHDPTNWSDDYILKESMIDMLWRWIRCDWSFPWLILLIISARGFAIFISFGPPRWKQVFKNYGTFSMIFISTKNPSIWFIVNRKSSFTFWNLPAAG